MIVNSDFVITPAESDRRDPPATITLPRIPVQQPVSPKLTPLANLPAYRELITDVDALVIEPTAEIVQCQVIVLDSQNSHNGIILTLDWRLSSGPKYRIVTQRVDVNPSHLLMLVIADDD
jgi:hypothetical protein